MLFPLLFNRWREGAIVGLILLCLLFLGQWKKADTALKEARLAYEHPATKESVRETSTGGAEVTVTRTWKTKGGRSFADLAKATAKQTDAELADREAEVTQITTWKAPVTMTRETAAESAPVSVGTILAPLRSDRWLLTVGVNRLTDDFDGKAFLAGYGWRNRFDLQAGVIRKDPWLMATLRF